MCIVGDEVGGNSSQKGDGHVGGTLHVYERIFTSQSKTSNKDKRFRLIGLTKLTGKPLMCCVIFKGKKCCSQTEIKYILLSRLIIILTINKSLLEIIMNMRMLLSSH